jgi:DNA-binding response OmpR family regulator
VSARTILVAEDDPEMRELVRVQLTAAGYEIIVVRNGEEALSRIRTFRPDAVVLDINLPDIDGYGVLEGIRATPDTAGLPILILSGRHAEDDVRRAILLGARDYVTKPFTSQQLLGRVARLFRGRFAPPTVGVSPS